MSFVFYDIILLVLFAAFVAVFLYTNRKNLKKEGLLFLYKTPWGIKIINSVGKKYQKTLKVLSYISIGLGYFLMVGVIYLFGKIVWIYISLPQIVREIKVPPIMPLVPYIDKMVPSLPPFYFTYWIIIIAIIAITHEFAHGIFMRRYNIGIKSTGFGFFPFFLPIFLAAFVEQDEKSMDNKSKFEQMTVLSAGTFANILTAIFFFIILFIFFSLAFIPSGVVFSSYSFSMVNVSDISSINGVSLGDNSYEKFLELVNDTELSKIKVNGDTYVATKNLIEESQNKILFIEENKIILYDDAPAINAGLSGAITEIDGVKINSLDKLGEELLKKSPGDDVKISAINNEEGLQEYNLVLGENPEKEGVAWIGVGFFEQKKSGVIGRVYGTFSSFKKPNVYYEPKFDGISSFIYNLLWWIILISISVALINMLPIGIFDGGRFFYLTVLGVTGNEIIAKKSFKLMTYLFLFLLFLLMAFWALNFW